MKVYLDTEFNGFGGELISLALVIDQNHWWYGNLPLPKKLHPWVEEHVVPLIDTPPLNPLAFRRSMQHWLLSNQSLYSGTEVICDWFEDAKHFFAQLAGPSFAKSISFECSLRLISTSGVDLCSLKPHHALEDAKALAKYIEYK